MKLFSRASEYAILALMRVVETNAIEGFSPRAICKATGIPEALGCKALVELSRAHILKGTPGPGGGYRLVRPLEDVTLLDIVLAVDGERSLNECPLSMHCGGGTADGKSLCCNTCTLTEPLCGLGHMCPLHELWKKARELVVQHLASTTLQDIANKTRKPHAAT